MGTSRDSQPKPFVFANVRCLECGAVYAKPAGGGTVRANPGCPECGYVGWIRASFRLSEARERRRSVVGRLPRHSA